MPGYIDPETKRFIFIKEMVPEIVVPDLTDFDVICFFFLFKYHLIIKSTTFSLMYLFYFSIE
jgi:hypothetical protein